MRPLEQAVDDWFLNSPSWPFEVDINKEATAFWYEGGMWDYVEIKKEMEKFITNLTPRP